MLICAPKINPFDLPLAKKLRTQGWIGVTVLCGGGGACFAMAVNLAALLVFYQYIRDGALGHDRCPTDHLYPRYYLPP